MMEAIVSIHEEGPKLTHFGVIVHYDNLFPLFLFYSVSHVDICGNIGWPSTQESTFFSRIRLIVIKVRPFQRRKFTHIFLKKRLSTHYIKTI